MANNFVNSFASIVTAGENYQSTASTSDNHTGPQLVYEAKNIGGSGVNSILVELDAANTGTSGITLTSFIRDNSTEETCTIASSSDVATVTKSNHLLQTGMYVFISGSSTAFVNGVYKITRTGANTFTYAQNSGAADGAAAGTIKFAKAYHIVKDVSIPANSTLKIIAGQKVVLNANDKVYTYASAATCDIIAGILQEVS